VGDNGLATDTQNVYICIEYTSEGIIKTGLDISGCVYDNFIDYDKSKFRGVAPNLNNRNLRHDYQYLFLIQYREMLAKEIEREQNNGNKAKKSVTPSSQLSPATTFTTKYSELSVSTRMYNMYTHGVEGLGKIAEERYDKDIGELATTQATNIDTIAIQISNIKDEAMQTNIRSHIKLSQAVNDVIDLAHDFGKIPDFNDYIDIIYPNDDDFKKELKDRLAALLSSSSGNIIVNKSHELQKANIVQLIEILRENLIIFPDIPAEKYLSRMQVFAEFIADMMSNPPPRRSNYTDSGKQVTIGTFKTYYGTLDEGDKILFNERVTRIMTTGATAGAGAMDDVIRKNTDKYPSILKKIQLDGCLIGGGINKDVNETITNVYGIFNVDISGNNNSGFNIIISHSDTSSVPLLIWSVPGNFHIIYDDIANYINEELGGDYETRGTNKEYNTKYKEIEFLNNQSNNLILKKLLLQCLKTFCDKIYRTSMNDIHTEYNIANGVTHVYTTDSYFYGDIIIQYLAGLAKSIPTTLRAGEQRLGDDFLLAENKAGAECNDGLNTGRGFYTNPGVDSSSYVDEHYKAILRKTLGYASMLQNLANQCCIPVTYTSGSGSESDSDIGSGSPRSTKAPTKNVFNFKLLENGKLFDSSPFALGSLIDGNIHSYRLINFVERFTLNYNPDYKKNTIEKYESKIDELFQLECNKVIENVKNYVKKLQAIMSLIISTNISEIKKAIIQLPDLEDLLTMSTPSFCYENEDTLLLEPDVSSQSQKTEPPVKPSFNSVTFSSDEITINDVNSTFKKMRKNQLVKEYTSVGNIITGPITLDLLYALKKLAPENTLISDKIKEIITDFCSSCGLKCNVSDVAMPGVETDVITPEQNAYNNGYSDGLNGEQRAKSSGIEDSNSRAYESGYINGIKNRSGATHVEDNGSDTGDGTELQMESGSGSESDNEDARAKAQAQAQAQARNVWENEQTNTDEKRKTPPPSDSRPGNGGSRNNSTRKRNPSKIPRRTIRRRAAKHGQKRTIRRPRRNNKRTQKRRK